MNPTAKHINHNHLGSANVITTPTALPVQFMLHLPYGEEFVKQLNSTYDERFTFTDKEKDIETGYYYFGARFDNVDLGFMSVDPMSDKYPSISPYAYCAWNPVKYVDPAGEEMSTHTDENGNVIAVFDDGDNGVYMHRGDARSKIARSYSPNNTSANGLYMGESLHSLSFADQGLYNLTGTVAPMEGMIIDFGSDELTVKADFIMSQTPSLLQYAINANGGGDWDIKAKISKGSKLYGKYASPRDAGNFVAGMVAASKGKFWENFAQFGYGAYNLSGNNLFKTGLIIFAFMGLSAEIPSEGPKLFDTIMNGEDYLSQRCINLGKQFQLNKKMK